MYALFNNAGIAIAGPTVDISVAEFQKQFDVNFFGIHRVSQACFPLLKESKGKIIMMSIVNSMAMMTFVFEENSNVNVLFFPYWS